MLFLRGVWVTAIKLRNALVPKLQLGNPDDEALASRDWKLELPVPNSQAGAWKLAPNWELAPDSGRTHGEFKVTALWLILSTVMMCYCSSTHAGHPAWELDGKVQVGAWSSDRSLGNRTGVFPTTMALQGKLHLTDSLRLFADGRVGDSVYFGEDRYAAAREFYLDYSLNNADIRIGKQLLPRGDVPTASIPPIR